MNDQIGMLLELSKAQREKKDLGGLRHANEAYGMAWKMRDLPLTVAALREKIGYSLYVKPDYDEAERLAQEVLGLINVEENLEVAAYAYNVLGMCSDIKGNYLNARGHYLQIIKLLENEPKRTRTASVTLGNAYHNIVKLYQQVEFEEDRFDYLEKALEVFGAINEIDGLAMVWNLKASLLPQDAPIADRLALFEKADTFYKQTDDVAGEAVCYANIGLCYCHMGQFYKGIGIMEEAYQRLIKVAQPPMIAFGSFQIAEACRLNGDHHKAIEYLAKAEETLLQTGAKVYLNVVYQEWAINLAAIGQYKEAYEKQKQYIEQVSDRLDFDRKSVAEETRLKAELEKKEKESEVLRRKNEEIELYNQKLQYSNAELNQFAYVASHDLKEPLRMVSNYMQLLEKSFGEKLTEDQSTYMRYANEGAKRMYKLIDSLLAYSRSTIDTKLKLVDLNDVLDEVERTVLSTVSREVEFESGELPTILGDHSQMIQLFQNLISNAAKYNNQDKIAIRVTSFDQEKEYRIVVEDNGLGIKPQYREQVFELFKRLHHRENYSGTGIGLSICKKIIHRLNGKIWIEDSSLGGTAFVFTIPKQSSIV